MVGFLISLPLWFWFDFDNADQFQFGFQTRWIEALGVDYHVGIDGITLLLVMLTTLIGPLAVLVVVGCDQRADEGILRVHAHAAGRYARRVHLSRLLHVLCVLGSDAGADVLPHRRVGRPAKAIRRDQVLPLYACSDRSCCCWAFWRCTSSIPRLRRSIRQLRRSLERRRRSTSWRSTPLAPFLSFDFQYWVFLAFFVGFAIKVPMFPFHTWLPDAHVEAPTAGSVILAAVLLKMGTYGFLRFSLPILPEGTKYFVPMMIFLSIVAIIYGALVAMMQPDMKKLVAYSSVSHMGFVMLGMFALNPNGLNGSIIQQINHGISTGALFLIVGMIYDRRHTREISQFGGISAVMPKLRHCVPDHDNVFDRPAAVERVHR